MGGGVPPGVFVRVANTGLTGLRVKRVRGKSGACGEVRGVETGMRKANTRYSTIEVTRLSRKIGVVPFWNGCREHVGAGRTPERRWEWF